jgi:sec-independent protein translocase protein TatB
MLSIPHLIVIFVVALIVFGPEKLPELARNFGKLMGEFRRATGDLRSTFEDHMRELEHEAEQRKIGGTTATASVAAGASQAGPTIVPAEGSVPAGERTSATLATVPNPAEIVSPEPSANTQSPEGDEGTPAEVAHPQAASKPHPEVDT